MKGTKKKANWTSTNKKIATVTQKGKVTAKSTGTTKIIAKIAKKKYSCTVKVTASDKINPTPTPTQEPAAPTVTPSQKPMEPTVSDNFEKLKNYIINEGSVNESGYHTISINDLNAEYGIDYIEINGDSIFSFTSMYVDDDAIFLDLSIMALNPLDAQSATFTSNLYINTNYEYIEGYTAKADIDPKSFAKNTTLTFEVLDNTTSLDNSTIQAFENIMVSNAFSAWETLLYKAGLNWADLGFTSY